jgi:NAD(P) transhydrogenase subunit alpha
MKIASILENQKIEKRVAITPEIAKKYISLGLEVSLAENYGSHLGIKDEEYKELGVLILKDEKEIISSADIIVQLGLLDDYKNSLLKENQTFVGVLNPYDNKDKINDLVKKNINTFSLELLPRITRAQSMDILSSQANLAGYKAVVESFSHFEKAIPMMMTAAGTIPAAKVLVVGAGVAGLQAIATAKRMGAIVFATDVRMASKEQVESLGGKFLTVEGAENLETEGGYAKEASDDFKKKQEELLSETLKKIDIVICTALIPGKKAPVIIKEDMISNMKPSSIIYDLAAIQGGNTAHTKVDEIVDTNGVKIMGESNILNKLPTSASNLYAKNVFNFVSNLYDKENNKININLEDEIIEKTLIK